MTADDPLSACANSRPKVAPVPIGDPHDLAIVSPTVAGEGRTPYAGCLDQVTIEVFDDNTSEGVKVVMTACTSWLV